MDQDGMQDTLLTMIRAACDEKKSGVVVKLETRLGELGVDSLKLIEIIFHVEAEFSLQADEELLAELETVGDIVDMFNVSARA